MKNTFILASALVVLVASSSVSYGQQPCGCEPSMGQQFRAGYDANTQWPRHYVPTARRSVCSAYDAMVNNGWRRQNLLGNYHFNQDTHELTRAGKLKVNWILSQAPAQRRNVFVQRGGKELDTTTRLASVQDYAAVLPYSNGQLNVNDTHIVAEGRSASAVDTKFQAFQKGQEQLPPPSPFLPTSSSK